MVQNDHYLCLALIVLVVVNVVVSVVVAADVLVLVKG